MQFEHMSFNDTMTRGTLLILRSWSRSQKTVSVTATVYSHFGIFVLCCAKSPDEPTGRRKTNEQTNALFWRRHRFTPWFRVWSPAMSHTKGGNSKSSLVFSKLKTHSSDCEGCHCGFMVCTTVVRLLFCVRGYAQTIAHNNKHEGNAPGHLSHCIWVRKPGFPWRDISLCRNCLLGPRSHPVLSGRGQEGSTEIVRL